MASVNSAYNYDFSPILMWRTKSKNIDIAGLFFRAFDSETGKIKSREALDNLHAAFKKQKDCSSELILYERLANKEFDAIPAARKILIAYFFTNNPEKKEFFAESIRKWYLEIITRLDKLYDGYVNTEYATPYKQLKALDDALQCDPDLSWRISEDTFNYYSKKYLSSKDQALLNNFTRKNKRLIEEGILYYQYKLIAAPLGPEKIYSLRISRALQLGHSLKSVDASFVYKEMSLTPEEIGVVEASEQSFSTPEACDNYNPYINSELIAAIAAHQGSLIPLLSAKILDIDKIDIELSSVQTLAEAAIKAGVNKEELFKVLDDCSALNLPDSQKLTWQGLKNKTGITSVDGLPEEVLNFLKNTPCKGNKTYYDFVKENVSHIILAPEISGGAFTRALGWESGPGGTASGFLKIMSISTKNADPFMTAQTLAHEANHIGFYRKNAGNIKLLSSILLVELAAYKQELDFSDKNSVTGPKTKLFIESVRSAITAYEEYLGITGWDPDNYGALPERVYEFDLFPYPGQ